MNRCVEATEPMVADHDRIVDRRIPKSHNGSVVQSDVPIVPRPPSWKRLPGIDDRNRHAVGSQWRSAATKEFNDRISKLCSHNFVSVKIEDPIVLALFFSKPLLAAKAEPILRDDASPFSNRDGDGVIKNSRCRPQQYR